MITAGGRAVVKMKLEAKLRMQSTVSASWQGWVGMKVTDTSLLGHVSSDALAASSLSDLWTMATGIFIQGSVLNIFVGNAIGAGNPKVAGEWFQVAMVVVGVISLPVMALWSLTKPALELLGKGGTLLGDAQYFSLVLMACIPARVALGALTQFFTAHQRWKTLHQNGRLVFADLGRGCGARKDATAETALLAKYCSEPPNWRREHPHVADSTLFWKWRQ